MEPQSDAKGFPVPTEACCRLDQWRNATVALLWITVHDVLLAQRGPPLRRDQLQPQRRT